MELFRFRIARDIQAQLAPNRAVLDLSTIADFPKDPPNWRTGEDGDKLGQDVKTLVPNLAAWLQILSAWLYQRDDYATADEVQKQMPGDWKTQVADPGWNNLYTAVATQLGAIFASGKGCGTTTSKRVEDLMRILRVMALVKAIFDEDGLPANQKPLTTAEQVRQFLSETVILPMSYYTKRPNPSRIVRKPGFVDLYIVKDEWNRYEPAQIAKLINVLPGETFDIKYQHYERTETFTSTTTQSSSNTETENSQKSSIALSDASTDDASQSVEAHGQVDLSAAYGPVKLQVSAGASLQNSQNSSHSTAFTVANEVVQRSVKTVSKTVVEIQTTRSIVGDTNTERHAIQNGDGRPVVGIYCWLSEIHRCQLIRYPHRFVLEFEIPEPGAWLKWAKSQVPITGLANPDPGPFEYKNKPISPKCIKSIKTIQKLAAKWRIQGLVPPPTKTLVLSVDLTSQDTPASGDGSAPKFFIQVAQDTSLIVPDGYQAVCWEAEIYALGSPITFPGFNFNPVLAITVGGVNPIITGGNVGIPGGLGASTQVPNQPPANLNTNNLSGHVGKINAGTIPVTAYGFLTRGFTCVINVTCCRMPETFQRWQQTSFDRVASAFDALKQAYEQELADRANSPGSTDGLAGPPALNKQKAIKELKRLVIEDLIGERFNGLPATRNEHDDKEPYTEITRASIVAPEIQFFEQAFEWENMVYICYPYYWGRRELWPGNANAATNDPEFDEFLNAGSARVTVPARPGLEHMVNYFLYTGCIWHGLQPPAPRDPDYLDIAHEIQALHAGANDGTPVGPSWEIALPVAQPWAGDDPAQLPRNRNPTIPAPRKSSDKMIPGLA